MELCVGLKMHSEDIMKRLMKAYDTKYLTEVSYTGTHKPYVREHKRIGRNQPCPCGSGKKYKKCHLGED